MGSSTAHYLAKEHGVTNVAVIEKGWIGSGNVGRNTTIMRSNYLLPGNIPLYELSLKLWEGLEQDLNYNAMVSQRGVLNLCHHRRAARRLCAGAAMRCGCTASTPNCSTADGVRAMAPFLDFDNARFPIQGGLLQRRGGTVRHDAVAWGYAQGGERARGRHRAELRSDRFPHRARQDRRRRDCARRSSRRRKSPSSVAGSTSRVAALAGLRLPIESHVLQAFVSEGLKPLIPGVITFGAGHFYVSQSDKGGLVFGGDIDGYNSYAQRGNLPMVEDVCESGMALMPMLGRLRVLRSWGGIMDMSMDGSPIIDKTRYRGALPQRRLVLRRLQGDPRLRLLLRPSDRDGSAPPGGDGLPARSVRDGRLIDERGAGAQPNLH